MLYLKCKKCNIEFFSWIRADERIFRTLDLRGDYHTCPNGHKHRYDQKDYYYKALTGTKLITHGRSAQEQPPFPSPDMQTSRWMEKQIEELRRQLDRTVQDNALLTERLEKVETYNITIGSLLERLQTLEKRLDKDATTEIHEKE